LEEAIEFTNFEIDDFVLYWNHLEHDLSVETLLISFPTTVGYPVQGSAQLTNLGWDTESGWDVYWKAGEEILPVFPDPPFELEAGESIEIEFDSNPDDEVIAWFPEDSGSVSIIAWHNLATDMDGYNDTMQVEAEVLNPGSYELGYDNRRAQYAVPFNSAGAGPLLLVTPDEHGEDFEDKPLELVSVKFCWYHDPTQNWPGEVHGALHVYDSDGLGETAVYSDTFDIEWQAGMPGINWQEIIISGDEPLEEVMGDFYVWLELLSEDDDDNAIPKPVAAEQQVGENHFFDYDGINESPAEFDYLLRVVVNAQLDVSQKTERLLPGEIKLFPATPNPFNSTTLIKFSIPVGDIVKVSVYDILGRKVGKLTNRRYEVGTHTLKWEAPELASGVYFVIMETGNVRLTRKTVLLK
jgi:hypothetical protein